MFREVSAHQTAMSKASPLLNGENIGGDFATGAELNVIAAMHDHISCAKTVEQFTTQDTNEGKMVYPCDFDHMYATMTDSRAIRDENTEIIRLKELLLLHLDLIQQQSEQIVTKDKIISALRQENDTLKQRLERMDRRVNLQKHKEGVEIVLNSSSAPSSTIVPSPYVQSAVVVVPVGDEQQLTTEEDQKPLLDQQQHQAVVTEIIAASLPVVTRTREQHKDDEDANNEADYGDEELPENKVVRPVAKRKLPDADSVLVSVNKRQRKRSVSLSSESSGKHASELKGDVKRECALFKIDRPLRTDLPHDKTVHLSPDKAAQSTVCSVADRKVQSRPRQKHKRGHPRMRGAQKENCLTTSELYYSNVGEDRRIEGRLTTVKEDGDVEVPSWRHKIYTSCYSMEGTENLDDEVFNKRHSKQELDERRRKRWDIQRIREQRQYERLKQRQGERQRGGSRGEEEQSSFMSLWPDPDEVEYVEVGETLPVSAFGHSVVYIQKSEFSLPWLSVQGGQSGVNNNRQRTEAKR